MGSVTRSNPGLGAGIPSGFEKFQIPQRRMRKYADGNRMYVDAHTP